MKDTIWLLTSVVICIYFKREEIRHYLIYKETENLFEDFLITIVFSFAAGALLIGATFGVISKFYQVEELNSDFRAIAFEATYSCKYTYDSDLKNYEYGRCTFEWEEPTDEYDCGAGIYKLNNIKIENCCVFGTDYWVKCQIISGGSISINLIDDKLDD